MAAIKGHGTSLYCSFDGTSYTKISDAVSIDGPSISVGTSETTNLDSTAAERIGTISDAGEVSGSLIYDPQESTHSSLTGLLVDAETKGWKLTFADASSSTFGFNGILTGFEVGGMVSDSHVTADYTISLTGVVDFDATAEGA